MTLLRWLDDKSDWLSPLVVKEVRQIVRGREFSLSFTGCLIAGLAIAFFGAADAATGRGTAGGWTFVALMGCLAVIGLAIVPLGAFSALRQERAEQTLDLITLTALTPRRLVIGKLLAQVVKLATLFAAIAPFVAMTFLLGGIDLTSIVLALVMLFLASAWICAACVLVSTLFKSRLVSVVLFALLGFVAFLVVAGGRGIFLVASSGGFIAGAPGLTAVTAYWALAIMFTVWLVTISNLVLLAENRLSLPTEDRVTPVRLGFFIQFLLILGWTSVFLFDIPRNRNAAAEVLAVLGTIHIGVVTLFCITEDLEVPRRVLQRLRGGSVWQRLLAIFRPGASHGAIYILVHMALLLGVAALFQPADPPLRWYFGVFSYLCFFTGVPVLAFRAIAPARATTLKLRLAVLGFIGAASLLPDLLYYIVVQPDVLNLRYSARHVLSPFRSIVEWHEVERHGWVLVPMALGVLGVGSYVALIRQGLRAIRHGNAALPRRVAIDASS